MNIWAKHMHESRERGWSCTLQPHMLSSILSSALWHTSRDGLQPDDQPLLIIQIQNDSKWIDDWIIGWKSIGEHLQAGTLPSLQLQNMAHESYVMNWEEATVVDTHPWYLQKCAFQSWHIRSETTTMNRDDGSLPQAYNSFLNHPRKPHTPH